MAHPLAGRAAQAATDAADAVIISSTTGIASTDTRQSVERSNPAPAKAPRILSRKNALYHPLTLSFSEIEIQEPANQSMSVPVARQSPHQPRLDQLARYFEHFFWRPCQETRAALMQVVTDIGLNNRSLEGTDASSLVSRIFRSHGLFSGSETNDAKCKPGNLSAIDVRSVASATLRCLAGSGATLFNVHEKRSLAYLLSAANDNGLLEELEVLIMSDMMLCGQHRVLDLLWSHAESAAPPLLTMLILARLSERLRYPIPNDAPLSRAIQLLQHWQQHQPPSSHEQDDFEAQLCGMTGPAISPDDFEDLLEMAFELGFCFANESLYCLIGQLIVESENTRHKDQYLVKLDVVLNLTGISANDIMVNEESALSRAVRRGNYRLFAVLLRYGASPDEKSDHQPSVRDQLSRQRSALLGEIDEVVKAKTQFTRHQYQKITSILLAQLHRNERMLSFLDLSKKSVQ